MLSRIFFVCLSVALYGAASSLSCRWMEQKFTQHSENYLNLLDEMASNSTNSTVDAAVQDAVTFPSDLYRQASGASAQDQLAFTAQILEETMALFEEDHSAASWEESTAENFVIVVSKQAGGLRSCPGSHGHKRRNQKLHMYFSRLSRHVLKKMEHSAEAWELIRRKIKTLLMQVEQLLRPLLPSN